MDTNKEKGRLVVLSNRVGPLSDSGKAGGLAVGLGDALRRRGGIWFGWSGKTSEQGTFSAFDRETEGDVELVRVDMTEQENTDFYGGYANTTLWPLMHYRLDLAGFERRFEAAYRHINQRMAARLSTLLEEDDVVWVHDYHYLLVGHELRETGFKGPIGFFLHIPFPPPEIFAALPNANSIVRGMVDYDVIGFQTERDCRNFCRYITDELGGEQVDEARVRLGDRTIIAKAYPIGIDAEGFEKLARSADALALRKKLYTMLEGRHQVVGVDRLDYSKGIPERLRAFDELLQTYPENRGKVTLLQIAPLSRAELESYRDLRRELEELAGHINGAFGTLEWTPIRIMTRGFTRRALAGICRASRVGLVTPLRDGMNLVAKEYVAAQDPENPGVLVLSRFAGAARELQAGALMVNPHDPGDVAGALQTAVTMPLAERQRRFETMREPVFRTTAQSWCADFLAELYAFRAGDRSGAA
ncbi:alpha,alpha-trehalose-phosphate synthase (UDP-forming) [Pararhizobium mangrovi]|uniref:Trehalose-6-phosphate synthase n=1 Tax=Pararhizobium mangrovi TaxID=2590452 RepID=A0A506UD53_9HYPH|nr:trehalose-6-phosphate synthase [Pararhizobium mangrovi]TPW30725.1 trehalose-6-phosphate synthase [Pararhizobium mangrovi]